MKKKRQFKYPNLREKAGSQYIWYEFQISGHPKPYRGSTETTNERQAYLFMQAVRVEKMKGPRYDEIVTMENLRDWDLERAKDVKTLDTVELHWRNLMGFFTDTAKIDHESLLAYVAHRQAKKLPNGRIIAHQTIQRELSALRRGWQEAKVRRKAKALDWADIWLKLKKDKKHKSQRARKWRSEEDIAFITNYLNSLLGESQTELLVALLTGIRFEELHRCSADLIHTVNGVTLLRVPEGKQRAADRDEDREVAMTPWIKRIFLACVPTSGSQHRSARRGAAKRLAFADWMHPPHMRDMRGLFSKVAMRSGVDSRIIDMSMGHGKIGTAKLYAEQPEQLLLRMAEAVEAYWRPRLTLNF